MSFRGGATGFREQGVGTAFLEHLLCAEHYVRCFVSFGIKRTIGPGRYSERRGTDEKIDQRESWSHSVYIEAMVDDKQKGFPTL